MYTHTYSHKRYAEVDSTLLNRYQAVLRVFLNLNSTDSDQAEWAQNDWSGYNIHAKPRKDRDMSAEKCDYMWTPATLAVATDNSLEGYSPKWL